MATPLLRGRAVLSWRLLVRLGILRLGRLGICLLLGIRLLRVLIRLRRVVRMVWGGMGRRLWVMWLALLRMPLLLLRIGCLRRLRGSIGHGGWLSVVWRLLRAIAISRSRPMIRAPISRMWWSAPTPTTMTATMRGLLVLLPVRRIDGSARRRGWLRCRGRRPVIVRSHGDREEDLKRQLQLQLEGRKLSEEGKTPN